MARPDPSTMSHSPLLDECLIAFRDAGRRHMACRIELERRLAELDRLRAIEANARDFARKAYTREAVASFDALKAALAAKET